MRLRLDGYTVADAAERTGLSAPTVSAAWKAFREGGWEAVPVRQRGRKTGQATRLDESAQQVLVHLLATQPDDDEPAWSARALAETLNARGQTVSPRAIEHWLEARDLKPKPRALDELERQRTQAGRWYRQRVQPVLGAVRESGGSVWKGGVRVAKPVSGVPELPRYQLYLHGKRGALHTRCLTAPPKVNDYLTLFQRLRDHAPDKPVALMFHGADFQASAEIRQWLDAHPDFHLINVPPANGL
ncbi:helix-turn-helix domain-containing protein [Halomonas sp. NO4]|uniref:helix-turn-helix domain-containing protein n=1 Tax=Halomonas sp. NO4 TaxID=2484813 RepID=UPI0013D28803|nr:helix-turn-helix domain-containing protein [Halomonas sp. NO4]